MNPILQALMPQNNNIMQLVSMIKNSNPEALYNQMIHSNPQFKAFIDKNKGKSAEQIAKENGIDINLLQQFINK